MYKITEDTGVTIDAGSLAEILDKGFRLYFHGAPTVLDESGEEDNPTVSLHLTSVSVVDDDGEFYVDLPEGGLYVHVPMSELELFMAD